MDPANNKVSTNPAITKAARSPPAMSVDTRRNESKHPANQDQNTPETSNHSAMESKPATKIPNTDMVMTPNLTGRQQQKVFPPSIQSL